MTIVPQVARASVIEGLVVDSFLVHDMDGFESDDVLA